jgi:hypothetical protein
MIIQKMKKLCFHKIFPRSFTFYEQMKIDFMAESRCSGKIKINQSAVRLFVVPTKVLAKQD